MSHQFIKNTMEDNQALMNFKNGSFSMRPCKNLIAFYEKNDSIMKSCKSDATKITAMMKF